MRPNPSVPAVDVRTAADLLSSSAPPLLVDVREADEFQTVRVEGAVLLPLSTFAARFEELPGDRPILVMCAGGGRSSAATAHLLANGWPDATNMAGGIISWERSGLPVKRGRLTPGEGDLQR
jgi:rhodanese-related sulfurtransferase